MDSIKIKNDRSCSLQALEGHHTEECKLSDECCFAHVDRRVELPTKSKELPSLLTQLSYESSKHDSARTQSSQSSVGSLWSGVVSQCGSAFSRATSVASSRQSHKRQHSASNLSYLDTKPLPELPPDSDTPESPLQAHSVPLSGSIPCLSASEDQLQKEQLTTDQHIGPLLSPALSTFTISSASSYASQLAKTSTESLRPHIRIFHPVSQNSQIVTATIDTGSDCCCIRVDILVALGIALGSPLIRPTRLSSKGITGSIWQPLGRIELTWSSFKSNTSESGTHRTWFFIGDEELPHPVLLGKDFLFPKEGPARVVAILVNVLNKPTKAERKMQKEAERQQEKRVRDNERAKELSLAAFQVHNSTSRTHSDLCNPNSITETNDTSHKHYGHILN